MKISLKRLKNKMVSVRAVLLTKTEANDPYGNEIWLKFKDDTFVFISFEHLIVGALDNIKFAYNSSAQFINQIFLGASRGLFFSAIIAYIMKAKINRD